MKISRRLQGHAKAIHEPRSFAAFLPNRSGWWEPHGARSQIEGGLDAVVMGQTSAAWPGIILTRTLVATGFAPGYILTDQAEIANRPMSSEPRSEGVGEVLPAPGIS